MNAISSRQKHTKPLDPPLPPIYSLLSPPPPPLPLLPLSTLPPDATANTFHSFPLLMLQIIDDYRQQPASPLLLPPPFSTPSPLLAKEKKSVKQKSVRRKREQDSSFPSLVLPSSLHHQLIGSDNGRFRFRELSLLCGNFVLPPLKGVREKGLLSCPTCLGGDLFSRDSIAAAAASGQTFGQGFSNGACPKWG